MLLLPFVELCNEEHFDRCIFNEAERDGSRCQCLGSNPWKKLRRHRYYPKMVRKYREARSIHDVNIAYKAEAQRTLVQTAMPAGSIEREIGMRWKACLHTLCSSTSFSWLSQYQPSLRRNARRVFPSFPAGYIRTTLLWIIVGIATFYGKWKGRYSIPWTRRRRFPKAGCHRSKPHRLNRRSVNMRSAPYRAHIHATFIRSNRPRI